jgi:UDP-glucose 4-epimerase
MNWLITGGCGFIGRNLIKELDLTKGLDSVRVLDNFSVGRPEDLDYVGKNYRTVSTSEANWDNKHVDIVEGDILDSDLAIEVVRGADVIVHLAANTGVGPSVEDPRSDCMINVVGVFNYLDASRISGVKRFVFASSGAPIGECNPPIHEELACHPVSPYGASKLAGEGYCSAYARSFSVETVALRFGNVYGPGSTHKSSVVAKFIRQALNRETWEIFGDGSQTRDFIYIKDLVNAIVLASEVEGIGGEVFQIATNHETTVNEITDKLVDVLNSNSVEDINVVHGPKRVGDVMRNFSDTTKAQQVLGWKTAFTLTEGLHETVNWFVNS